MTDDNTLKFQSQKVAGIESGSNVIPFNRNNNGNGGEPPMDKYVTHKELELSNEKLLHHIDNRFNEMDKHFNKLELEMNDVKNTVNTNKEKINWVLYSVIGGIIIGVLTTLITNLLKWKIVLISN